MIDLDDIIQANKEFDEGIVINKSSLDFARSHIKDSKDWIKQLAFITRAILCDHVFKEANKRTATALIATILEKQKLGYDLYKLDKIIIEITKKNITNINKIRSLIKDVIR